MLHYLSEEEIAAISNSINESITKQTYSKLSDSSVGDKVAHIAIDHLANKFSIDGAQELLSGISGAIGGIKGMADGLFGGSIVAKFLGLLREPAEHFLAKHINDMLKNNGAEIVSNMIDGEVDSFLTTPVCELLKGHDEQLTQAVNATESIYRTVISEHLPRILESIDNSMENPSTFTQPSPFASFPCVEEILLTPLRVLGLAAKIPKDFV